MTAMKKAALTAGVAGAFALGVVTGPALWDRDDRTGDTPAAQVAAPAATETAKARVAPKRAARTTPKAVAMPASTPELHEHLKPVLNRGTKMSIAADGFESAEQFAMVAHAARNTEVPFMVLKHRVLEEGKSLTAAIRESKPDVNAAAEVRRARAAARQDLSKLTS
jgi:hypothetical protein